MAFTRTGMPLRAISVASILVRWLAAAFALLYANFSPTITAKVWGQGCAHVSLRNLQNSTDTGDVDNTGRVAFDVSTALV